MTNVLIESQAEARSATIMVELLYDEYEDKAAKKVDPILIPYFLFQKKALEDDFVEVYTARSRVENLGTPEAASIARDISLRLDTYLSNLYSPLILASEGKVPDVRTLRRVLVELRPDFEALDPKPFLDRVASEIDR